MYFLLTIGGRDVAIFSDIDTWGMWRLIKHCKEGFKQEANNLGDPSIPHITFPFYLEAFMNIKVQDTLRGIFILCHTYK